MMIKIKSASPLLTSNWNSGAIFIFIFLLLVFPSFSYYFGYGSSLGLGTSVVSAFIIVFSIYFFRNDKSKLFYSCSRAIKSGLIVIFLVFFHLIITSIFVSVDWLRAVLSIFIFFVIFLSASNITSISEKYFFDGLNDSDLDAAILKIFIAMCFIAVLANFGLSIDGINASPKPVFPYVEPSHFALCFIPILMYMSISGTIFSRTLSIAAGLICTVALENLTLGMGCLLVICINLKFRMALVISAIFLIIFLKIDLSYYIDRLNFSGDTQNLSTLVFIQGWQLIGESWLQSSGWGIGFQQMGQTEPNVPASNIIFKMLQNYSNLPDGGFTFSKIISEFGFVGIFIFLIFLMFLIRALIKLRKVSIGAEKNFPIVTLSECFILSYVIELFIRGAGYFTPTTLVVLASIIFNFGMVKKNIYKNQSLENLESRVGC